MENKVKIQFDALSSNEGFARVAIAAFASILNPTLEELADIKTAVSEAVTNSIIHGYEEQEGIIYMECKIQGDTLHIQIRDEGKGIPDIEKAMEPLYTTKPELDRSGMGFSFMEAFMDDLEVISELGEGTKIQMIKKIGVSPWILEEE